MDSPNRLITAKRDFCSRLWKGCEVTSPPSRRSIASRLERCQCLRALFESVATDSVGHKSRPFATGWDGAKTGAQPIFVVILELALFQLNGQVLQVVRKCLRQQFLVAGLVGVRVYLPDTAGLGMSHFR